MLPQNSYELIKRLGRYLNLKELCRLQLVSGTLYNGFRSMCCPRFDVVIDTSNGFLYCCTNCLNFPIILDPMFSVSFTETPDSSDIIRFRPGSAFYEFLSIGKRFNIAFLNCNLRKKVDDWKSIISDLCRFFASNDSIRLSFDSDYEAEVFYYIENITRRYYNVKR